MNNPFENFDDWDEDIAENPAINLHLQHSNNMLPRLQTTDTQIHQIGYHLGRHYPASVINRNINRNRIRVEQNLNEIDRLTARGINARDQSFIDILIKRADKYANKLEHWVRIAENKRYERDTGVTRIRFPL